MDLYSLFFFIMGLYHNVLLSLLFYFSKQKNSIWIKNIGKTYLFGIAPLISIALIWGVIISLELSKLILILIIIAFVLLEILFDWILKINFRKNWLLLIPYLIFYYSANYAIVIIPWDYNIIYGIILLILMIIQIGINTWSHINPSKKSELDH